MKASNNFSEDAKESYTLDRVKTNGIGVKNVLFAPGVERSSSSYLLNNESLLLSSSSSSNLNHSNSITPITSTSQLIKQTLSPLVHHRPTQQTTTNALSDSKGASSSHKMKSSSVSMSFGSYQLSTSSSPSSNTFSMGNSTGNGSKNNFPLSATIDNTSIVSPSQRTSSPSRSLSSHTNTNTLPSHVGRSNNIQYHFESNYSHKNKPKNFTSPENTTFFNALSSITSSSNVTSANQTSTGTNIISSAANSNISISSSIYGTLPKSAAVTNSLGASNNSSGVIYGNVSAVANEFEQLIARNANSNNSIGGMVSNSSSNSHGNYNTLGSYRVQYSSTNPFLNHFGEPSTTDDK